MSEKPSDDFVERAARALCDIRGLNADEMVGHGAKPNGSGFVPAVLLYSPRWQLVADEVRDRMDMDAAIATASEVQGER